MTTFLSNPLDWWNVENTNFPSKISLSNIESSPVGTNIGISINSVLILFSKIRTGEILFFNDGANINISLGSYFWFRAVRILNAGF
jgi:hypothetical protein